MCDNNGLLRCAHYSTDAQRHDGGDSGGEGLTCARGEELLHGCGLKKKEYMYERDVTTEHLREIFLFWRRRRRRFRLGERGFMRATQIKTKYSPFLGVPDI